MISSGPIPLPSSEKKECMSETGKAHRYFCAPVQYQEESQSTNSVSQKGYTLFFDRGEGMLICVDV